MKALIIPKKYSRQGLKVYCSKCNKQVSSCGLTKKNISTCQYTSSHKFKAIIHIPNSDYKRRSKLMKSRNIEEALLEMTEYKKELKESNYQPTKRNYNRKSDCNLLVELCQDYIHFIAAGEEVPEHLKRNRSKLHQSDITRVLLRLNTALKKSGYSMDVFKVERLGDVEVGIFHNYLLQKLSLGKTTYNRHISIVNSFYKWLDKHRGLKLENPFARIELTKKKTVVKIITNDEFSKLLSVINKENGLKEGEGEKRNRYRTYLKDAYRVALNTGCRREELALLKWNDIIELEEGVEVIKIENLKVNRIMTGNSKGEHQRYIPMTKSLKQVLFDLNYVNKKGKDCYIIERPESMEMTYFMDTLSRSFSHYYNLISDRSLNFKDLRKTYITRMTEELGSNAKIFTGHTNDEVLKGHYIASEYTAAKLNDLDLFEDLKS